MVERGRICKSRDGNEVCYSNGKFLWIINSILEYMWLNYKDCMY